MKLGVLLTAFVMGCYATITMTTNTAEESTAKINPVIMEVTQADFGKTADDAEVTLFTCTNKNGYILKMIDYGATVVSFEMPDKDDNVENVTLSCPDIKGYEACGSYFGCSVGRYCNRIAGGKFTIDGEEFTLATNNGDHHLHGGNRGWDKVMWNAEPIETDSAVGVRFKYRSVDGEEGYPGNVDAQVEYLLNNDNELIVRFQATSDKPTHLNLTNHNYWNLSGQDGGTISEHQLKLASTKYLPVDSGGIPTGELVDVENTAFDFREFHAIGERLKDVGTDPLGYDHCYALDYEDGKIRLAATVKDPASGRVMEILTTQPGIQFYSGNFLDGSEGSGGFDQYHAFCLETQHFPDAPNQPQFKSTLVSPGQTYQHETIHRFSVVK